MLILKNTNNRYKIKSKNGIYQDFDGIRITDSKQTYVVEMENGFKIKTTPEHLLLSEKNNFVKVSDLKIGNVLSDINGVGLKIKNIYCERKTSKMYDILEVSNGNIFASNGLLSHNCSFMGSSDTLLSSAALANLSAKNPIRRLDNIFQYEPPLDGQQYAIVADVGRGKGLDYSAFSIFNITQMPYKQVCVFRSNQVTPLDYATIIHNFAKQYNNAMVLIEVNDIGGQVADAIYIDYGYEYLISTKTKGRAGKSISGGFGRNVDRGIRTSEKVKIIGCSILKLLIEQEQLLINDAHTINELKRFSKKGTSYAAEPGAHDDLVMTLVLFAWMSDQGYFKEVTEIDTMNALRDANDEEIENQMLPFFFVSGYESDDSYWKPI